MKFWAQDLSQCLKEVEVTHPQSLGSCIKSLYLLGSMLLIGTRTGEMYEMDTTSYSYSLIMQGHSYGAVHGMAVHPFEHQFVTTGDDMTVRVWDVPSRRMLLIRDLGGKGRSCAYHPDGSQIAIGLVGGGYAVLSSDSLDTIHQEGPGGAHPRAQVQPERPVPRRRVVRQLHRRLRRGQAVRAGGRGEGPLQLHPPLRLVVGQHDPAEQLGEPRAEVLGDAERQGDQAETYA